MLDPVGIQMPQLDLVLIKEPEQEAMGGSYESMLMEVHERHHITIRRRREPLIAREDPFERVSPRGQEPTMDETQHVRITACRATPQIHGGKLRRAKGFGYGDRIGGLAGGGSKSEEG
jgi:hypothetical protein